jgi:predicted nucleic acid-binding protein
LVRRIRFLLDTSVVSELARKRPDPTIVAWLKSPGDFDLVLPFAATTELYRGAELKRKEAPDRAAALDEWADALLESNISTPEISHDVAKLYGRIAAVPALKDIWAPDPRMKAPKMGLDLLIAAQSIAQSIPVATINIKDFKRIHQHFPLPGVFHPGRMEWSVEPLSNLPQIAIRAA